MVWAINLRVCHPIYRSDFTSPKWEAEWTEKETWDLWLYSDCCSQHLHPDSIYQPDFCSLLSSYCSLLLYLVPMRIHISTLHGDWTLTSDCQAEAHSDAIDSECCAVILSPCLGASQGAVRGGGALSHLSQSYRGLLFGDVVI
jgi:hypothetical protein